MTTHTQVVPLNQSKFKLVFGPSRLATQHCQGIGVEIGAAAHNPFYLENCTNVCDEEGYEFYKAAQIEMCGSYADVDLLNDAAALDITENALDYVISSHMWEHHPDPMTCLLEWFRVVKDGGVIFTIVPKRNAHPNDVTREVSTIEAIVENWGLDLDSAAPAENGGRGGHYWVFDEQLIRDVVAEVNVILGAEGGFLDLELWLDTDDKVGNGHLFILRVQKDAPELDSQEPEPAVP